MTNRFQDQLDLLYQAVIDPHLWSEFIADLTRSMNAQSSVMLLDFHDRKEGELIASSGFTESSLVEYGEYYFAHDIWTERLWETGSQAFQSSDSVLKLSAFKQTEFYSDYAKPLNMHHAAAAYVSVKGNCGLRMAIQRSEREGEFSKEELHQLNALRPHISRAIALSEELQSRQRVKQSIEEIIQHDNRCMIIVDANARVTYCNQAAEGEFESGAMFNLVNRALTFCDANDQVAFKNTLLSAAAGAVKSTGFTTMNGQSFTVTQLPHASTAATRFSNNLHYLVVARGATGSESLKNMLTVLHALTAKEVDIVLALSAGYTINDISEMNQRSIHTVRTQVKTILNKMAFSNQNQLIAYVARLTQ